MRFDLTINDFVLQAFDDKIIEIYDHDTIRPYCHIFDFARAIYKVFNSNEKKVRDQIFNVGSNKNNKSKIDIIKHIQKIFPQIQYKIIKNSKDKRDYNVSFNKIKNRLNFKPKYSINFGILEIINFLRSIKSKKVLQNQYKLGNFVIIKK